jgi:hypothetical protein
MNQSINDRTNHGTSHRLRDRGVKRVMGRPGCAGSPLWRYRR